MDKLKLLSNIFLNINLIIDFYHICLELSIVPSQPLNNRIMNFNALKPTFLYTGNYAVTNHIKSNRRTQPNHKKKNQLTTMWFFSTIFMKLWNTWLKYNLHISQSLNPHGNTFEGIRIPKEPIISTLIHTTNMLIPRM